MQIQVKWQDGAFHPVQPLNVKHRIVTIDVPDEEIEEITTNPVIASSDYVPASIESQQLVDRFKEILGPYHMRRAGSTMERDKELLMEALEEKYGR